ncbi:MAG: hypothetical protein JWM80_1444 [Cyanobacteria bacterium RYN_339]|nr:hypothetical protein [Cyanobacteria bacterium RYN_339]
MQKRSPAPALLAALFLAPAAGFQLAVPAPAIAAEATILERPVFDRDNNVILIPFRGSVPRFDTQITDNGTRLLARFSGSQVRPSTPYKLGVFHPLVARVEMTPQAETGSVNVAINLTQPGSLNVVPDTRRGMLRLQVGPAKLEPPIDLSTPVGPQPIGLGAAPGQPALPRARMPEAPPGQPPIGSMQVVAPQPVASVPPVGFGVNNLRNPLPGTPASGEYVYRKAIPSANGNDVTEVLVRTGTRSNVGVDRNVDTDAVQVNVRPPLGLPVGHPQGWERPLANEPWRQPVYRGESTYRPVAALDTHVGFTLMGENAPKLGSNFTGAGATMYGGSLQVPIGNAFNLRMSGDAFAYKITTTQVPDATTRRDEYFGDLALEFLPIRRPWVLATGVGYWARYLTTKSNVLAPPEPSILFQPTMLWHGPSLVLRTYVPVVWEQLALVADAEAAPYMFGLSDSVSTALGNMYGYQGQLGMKYSTRHFSLAAGYRYQGYGTFNQSFSYNRSGPEMSLVWRF